jgi:hypothetical protein
MIHVPARERVEEAEKAEGVDWRKPIAAEAGGGPVCSHRSESQERSRMNPMWPLYENMIG